MLEISAPPVEAQLEVNFSDIYAKSSLYQYAYTWFLAFVLVYLLQIFLILFSLDTLSGEIKS